MSRGRARSSKSGFHAFRSLPEEIPTPTSPQEISRAQGRFCSWKTILRSARSIRDILTGLGYFVLEAANAEDAIAVAESYLETIDLMVSDIVMPGLSGFELSKRLASSRPAMRGCSCQATPTGVGHECAR